jgi:membrane protein required for colicin V production
MNWVDLAILGVIALSAVIGWMRGFVREMLGLVSWALAAWIAVKYYHTAAPFAAIYIPNPDIGDPVAFGAVFLAALIFLSVIASIIGRLARDSSFSMLDGTLGIAFGAVRGVVLMFCAYIAGGMLLPAERWPPVVQDARSLPYIYSGAVWVRSLVPAPYQPGPPPPPPNGRETRAADLLQATPTGHALGGVGSDSAQARALGPDANRRT